MNRPDGIDAELQEVACRFPVGRPVRFYPVAGHPDAEETKVRSEPWRLGHGEIVVKIDGRTGGVLVDHLELLPIAPLQAPLRAGHHCRHYSYEQAGPGASGPRCAKGVLGSEPGAALCCMPQPRFCCDFREEYTEEERTAWRAWWEESAERLSLALEALPKAIPLRSGGTVSCPNCGQKLRYDRWQGGASVVCATPFCVEARLNLSGVGEWPVREPEPLP